MNDSRCSLRSSSVSRLRHGAYRGAQRKPNHFSVAFGCDFHIGPCVVIDWSHELIVAAASVAFSLLYLWRRNLWFNIIAHFMVDG